jgi:transcriptional regulator with XRE-family HTH domain
MDVFDYLHKYGMSQQELADSLGTVQSVVAHWKRGRLPSLEMACRVEKVTRGEVMPSSFLDLQKRALQVKDG